MSQTQPPTQYAPDTIGIGRVFAAVGLVALVGAFFLGRQYAHFTAYIQETVERPTETPPWRRDGMTPETCVDAAMTWARDCHGVKGLCDEYVTRVMQECLQPLALDTYCARLDDIETTARFGQRECAARGVQREVDSQACSNGYKAIAEACSARKKAAKARATGP